MRASEEHAERVLLEHALARGYLQPGQVAQAQAEVAQARARGEALGLVSVLVRLLPEHLHPELSRIYRDAGASRISPVQASEVRAHARGEARTPVSSSGRVPTPSHTEAHAQSVVEGLQAVYRQIPDFAPHANLVLKRVAELGKGGMGAVYRVHDERLGREAALKVILGEADASALRRFRREAQITARLDHPAIPPVYEAGTTAAGEAYMLMRVIEGETLSLRIKDLHLGGLEPAGIRELLGVLVKTAEAVGYAHTQGVIHRDLKPENVMVGAFGEVLVMDWGLAREEGKEEASDVLEVGQTQLNELEAEAAGLTQVGSIMGTPGYMAPEQAEGLAADARSDLYALGAILVEALTGSPPITGATVLNVVVATSEGKVELPLDRDSALPAELNSIARKALALEARHRYLSAEELVGDLKAYLAGQVVAAHDYGLVERTQAFLRGHPSLVMATLVCSLAAVIGVLSLAWSTSESARVAAEQAAEVAQADRSRAEAASLDAERARAVASANEREARAERLKAEASEAQAEAARVKAVQAEREGRSFSDSAKLQFLLERRRHMFADPESLGAWLGVANTLIAAAPEREARRAELETLEVTSFREQIRQTVEADVLDEAAKRTRTLKSWIPNERARLRRAPAIREGSLTGEAARRAWQAALAAIAASPRYKGVELEPVLGLFPLGPDPVTGLWEFWHLETGTRPERNSEGVHVVSAESGLVLVLVPGGRFQMGDEDSPDSTPVHEVRISPFFLSKYEVTQRQWLRATGESLGDFPPGAIVVERKIGTTHPVERVSYEAATFGTTRVRLRLPTESEWEYAARGGAEGLYAGLSAASDLEGYANLADRQLAGYVSGTPVVPWDDGHIVHAPVGSYRPNGFGLYDMAGNVFEWTLDVYRRDYKNAYSDGRPSSSYSEGTKPYFVYRGGGFANNAKLSKSTARRSERFRWHSKEVGVRAACSLDGN